MGFVGNHAVFVMCAMTAIALAARDDGGDGPRSNDNALTESSGNRRRPRPHLHFVYTIVRNNFRFYNQMLDLHQDHRIKHSANYLLWTDDLYKIAMNCLKSIIEDQVDPSQVEDNCFTYILEDAERVTPQTIFEFWYQEGRDYDYTQAPVNTNAKHFTQIVWKSSETVGFAFKYENNTNYFAAAYSPKGNVLDQYLENVGRPIPETVEEKEHSL